MHNQKLKPLRLDPELTVDISKIQAQISQQLPFSLLEPRQLESWLNESKIVNYKIGQRILRPDELNGYIFLVLKGTIRLVGSDPIQSSSISLGTRGSGQLIGWISLLRSVPTENVIASTDTLLLALPSQKFVNLLHENRIFLDHFSSLTNPHESHEILVAAALKHSQRKSGWQEEISHRASQAKVYSVSNTSQPITNDSLPNNWQWLISTGGIPGFEPGTVFDPNESSLPLRSDLTLPVRLIGVPTSHNIKHPLKDINHNTDDPNLDVGTVDLHQLGILEEDKLDTDQIFPHSSGHGELKEALAVCQTIALSQKVPFRPDSLTKILEDQLRRGKAITLELIASMCEFLGLSSQIGTTSKEYLRSVEGPAILIYNSVPVVFFTVKNNCVVISHPNKGIVNVPTAEFISDLPDDVRFVIARRVSSTPTSRFGWNWFTPLLKKYKRALVLVFISSLLAQLFGLAIPLLIQQIIDKVLSQGNLASLNVLGSTMIVLALFQGILRALRTYIFVDTTDRMDLTLGSAVIDRLLALPLSYFEKRPVGELSQRLGELNTIRNFLTGTALLSILNILFAVLYLVVMFIYSPILSVVALSTFPLYLLLVFVVAPIYKTLIRARAVAAAKTQSHLIEIIGGIQTVKAQHFELTARWKWQDRYRHFVTEGFKSVALGSTSGEIGGFLNQVSGLLVLWVGMSLVIQGDFTLGQLIAFRIIAGNVTGPLLQLAGLYQGFQSVQLSMERLGDIIDQNPELNSQSEHDQISLPPIIGDVRFEDISFRFGKQGPKQLNNINVSIKHGSFVGIVGQSGSGKSTLMKLLPRLYNPDSGRIFIDDYDIQKVELASLRRQVGIVPQDSLLFEGTVAENISLNYPEASTESIIEAAKIACAHDFIMSLSEGYATQITEKGSNLSGGQRQRIAIARTVLSNPQLLVMDEATSALDFETERQLCNNLQKWASDRTVFFITHRLSTVQSSDIILLMHQGFLEEIGTHSDLISKRGRYASLFKNQQASE